MKKSNIYELMRIFSENEQKRICVIGTTCTGKSTLINVLSYGKDMDKEIFPLLTQEEKNYVCQTTWTEEIGQKMNELVKARLKITQGVPMFGTVLLDCDLIVYLHINDNLLKKRTEKRNVDFNNAKNMQIKIEKEIEETNIETIEVEVQDFSIKEVGRKNNEKNFINKYGI